MAEEEVRTKLPNVHAIIARNEGEKDWDQVKEDLSALNWLDPSVQTLSALVTSVFKLLDGYALADLSKQPRLKLLRLNTVKIFINSAFFHCSAYRNEMKEAATECKARISELEFFVKAKEVVTMETNERLLDTATEVAAGFEDLKDMAKSVTLHLKNTFISDFGKEIDDYLDEQFFKKVLRDRKAEMREFEGDCDLLRKYDRVSSASTGYTTHYNYSHAWPATYAKDNIYFGEVNDEGLRHGYGEITYANGDVYKGNWVNDKPEGRGVYVWKEYGRYEGDFVAGKMQGNGKRVYQSGNVYTGSFVGGRKQGHGFMKYSSGDEYNGEWDDDYMHGMGTYVWAQGDSFTGRFSKDKREGKGTLTLASGEVIEGEWISGKMRNVQV